MLAIEKINDNQIFATTILEFLFSKHNSIKIDTNRVKGKDWKSLKKFERNSLLRRSLFQLHSFELKKSDFDERKSILSEYFVEWGFYIDKQNHGLFTRETKLILLSDRNQWLDTIDILNHYCPEKHINALRDSSLHFVTIRMTMF
jgi:hypothetical protein